MAKTNTVHPLDLTNCIDPRLEALSYGQEKLKWAIPKGCSYSNHFQQKAAAYSTSGVNWNFNTAGENILIDKRIYAKVQFQVSITGIPANGGYLVNDGLSAPRAFPLASVVESLTLGLNGSSITVSYADALQGMVHYSGDKHNLSEYDLSGTPTMLDKFAVYSDGIGSLKNPLNSYQSGGYETPRGSFKLDSIVNPVGDGVASKTAIIKFTVVEPLMISPLSYSSSRLESALIGVNNMSVQMNFGGDLSRVWSHAVGSAGETVTSVSVAVGSGTTEIPELLLSYLSTPLTDHSAIPRQAVYDYYRSEVFQNDQSVTLGAGATQTFTLNAIQLSIVPKSITIYAALPRGSKTYADSDTFFKMNSISLQYLNVSGQFSSMTINDLYNMSVKNGCKLSFQEWSGQTTNYQTGAGVPLTGSVLRIDVTDLALPANLAAGCPVSSQLQFQVSLTNTSSQARAVSIYTVIGQEGLMTIAEGSMTTSLGVVSSEDVLATRASKDWTTCHVQSEMYGGSFWDKVKSFGKTIGKAVGKVAPLVEHMVPKDSAVGKYLPKALDVGKSLGLLGDGLAGGRKGRRGGALVGGRAMSRSELKELL